jgi:hypothetical protein
VVYPLQKIADDHRFSAGPESASMPMLELQP